MRAGAGRKLGILGWIGLVIVLTASTARAQPPDSPAAAPPRDPAAAEALFAEARDALDRGKLDVACAKLIESQRLDPAPGTLLNLADCEERRGRLLDARLRWLESIAALPQGDDRLPIAKDRLAALEQRLPWLTLRLAPGAPRGVAVAQDGVALGEGSLGAAVPVRPGEHEVVVTAPGREERRVRVTLQEGERRELTLEVGALLAPPAPRPAPVPAPAPDAGDGRRMRRTLGFVAGGVGLAGIGAAVVSGILLDGKKAAVEEHCDEQRYCDAEGLDAAAAGRTLLPVNTVAWVVGIAGVGAGAALILTSGGEEKARVKAAVLPGGAGMSVGGRF